MDREIILLPIPLEHFENPTFKYALYSSRLKPEYHRVIGCLIEEFMKISAIEEFGLRCLLHVAKSEGPVTSVFISETEGISVPYVQKLLRLLSKANLVKAQRGVNGGFQLERPAHSISVGEVLRAFGTDDSMDSFCEKNSGEFDTCRHTNCCTIQPIWIHIMKLVVHTLDNLPLSVLLESPQEVSRSLDSIVSLPLQTFCPVGAISQYTGKQPSATPPGTLK